MTPTDAQQQEVRQAARALARAGLVHAYGHCSERLDQQHFLVCAAMPMGQITTQPGTVVPVDGSLPEGVLGEVRIHREVYRRRADVGGICRVMPPITMALSTAGIVPRPRHGIGAYFDSVPLWDDPRLLRNDAAAEELADLLEGGCALVMRGNGAITVGESLPQAVTLAYFLEDAARVERDIRAMALDPGAGLLTRDEITSRQVWSGGVVDRMWAHLTDNAV